MVINPPRIGVVILNFNSAADTLRCLATLREANGGERRAWVVDNGSSDGSGRLVPPALAENEVWLPLGSNFGYAAGNNVGIREALQWGAEYALILNPDVIVEPGFLQPLIRALEAVPKAGAACSLVLDSRGERIQSLGGSASLMTGRCRRRLYGRPIEATEAQTWTEVDFPLGACVLFRRECLEEIGLFNEAYFLYYEDVEIGLRARRETWRILAIPHSRVRHQDTTEEGAKDPAVVYHGTRNQVWVVAEYGRRFQRLAFFGVSILGRWPLRAVKHLLAGRLRCAWAVARGAWDGYFSKAWCQACVHLALPRMGRPLKPETLQPIE